MPQQANGEITMKNFLIIVASLTLFVGAIAGRSFYRFQKSEKAMQVFDTHLDEYFSAKITDTANQTQPYTKGALITLDIDSKTIDWFTFPKLDESIKAKTPEEMKTIVMIKWGEIKEGDYLDEKGVKVGEAFRSTATLTIIDWEKKTKIGEKIILGQSPLKTHQLDGDFKSAQPMFKVIEYLEQLPQK